MWHHESVFEERSATAEQHLQSSDRWRSIAEQALESGDQALASEALWGATSQIVQAVAKRQGQPHENHTDFRKTASWLSTETANPNLTSWYSQSFALHRNFYRIVLSHDEVRDRSTDAIAFLNAARPFAHAP